MGSDTTMQDAPLVPVIVFSGYSSFTSSLSYASIKRMMSGDTIMKKMSNGGIHWTAIEAPVGSLKQSSRETRHPLSVVKIRKRPAIP
jgi:hypothetical protein